MTNYALPVNDKDISKAKTFYDLICWGGLLIVLLPVGIANVILGAGASVRKWPTSASSRSSWCATASSPSTSPRCS